MLPALRAPLHLIGITALAVVVGAVSGLGSWALFEALDAATSARLDTEWLVWLLPVAAFALGAAYHYCGADANKGTSLVITESLAPIEGPIAERAVVAVAARLGATRLIDNLVLGEEAMP